MSSPIRFPKTLTGTEILAIVRETNADALGSGDYEAPLSPPPSPSM